MNTIRKVLRELKVPCAICGRQTRFKSNEIGYKCYNLKCDSRKLNARKHTETHACD